MFKSLFGLLPQVEKNTTAELTPETPLERVRIDLKNGRVKLRTWENPWVQAQVHVKATGGYAEEAGPSENTDIFWNLEQRGAEAVFAQKPFTRIGMGCVTVDVELLVPTALEARVETHNGSVEIEQYDGLVRAHTHNGSVRLHEVNGSADLTSHNGKIEASRVNGSLRLLTHNGAIGIEEVLGEVRAETHNGRIEATDCREELLLETHNGTIRVRQYHEMNFDIKLATSNGAISMDIPRSASAQLEMNTSLGGIKGDALPVQGSGISQKLNVTLGDGKQKWHLRTDRGAIVVNYA